jgi:hypothetical protein
MKNSIFLIILALFSIGCSKTTLLDEYREEISALKTESEIDAYWDNLSKIDQTALEKGKYSVKEYDSISITHMMRTALIFEIHGTEFYKLNNSVPEMHFTHNYFGPSTIAFWPIIKQCISVRGNNKIFGYPAYQLEGITNNFYDYSIYGQKDKYDLLLNKLNKTETNIVSQELFDVLSYQKRLTELSEVVSIGKWYSQQIRGNNEDGYFEFIKMSDNQIYCKKNGRVQKLDLIKNDEFYKVYRVEKEPFGWSYILKNNGDLTLVDDKNEILINYSNY